MNIIIFGGAGFIGSYLVENFLRSSDVKTVVVFDNFSSGRLWHLKNCHNDPRLVIQKGDIKSLSNYTPSRDFDLVVMLAANPDISRAVIEPTIDFDEGTVLVQRVLEFMRRNGVSRLLYASGSGVYGDVGTTVCDENFGPLIPISTYGASKLGCEALIASYSSMFGVVASCFRFGNVVGGRQTHGVAYDFIRRLRRDPTNLSILGNGNQSKPYVHISDIVQALDCVYATQRTRFEVYNVAPVDHVSVNDIVSVVIRQLRLSAGEVRISFSGGDRGWKGDVPIVRLDSTKIRRCGWRSNFSSLDAVTESVREMITNIELIEYAK